MLKFLIHYFYPDLIRYKEEYPKRVDERKACEKEKKGLEKRVLELETFISNAKEKLQAEGSSIKKIVTTKDNRPYWLELQITGFIRSALEIYIYDLKQEKVRKPAGEFFSIISNDSLDTYSGQTISYLSLINIQIFDDRLKNFGLGQILFDEAIEWIKENQPELDEIRGEISSADVGKGENETNERFIENRKRVIHFYTKNGARITWLSEEEQTGSIVAVFRIPLK